VAVCCGAVYKGESNDLILIDVAKFKPCQRRHHGSLAHLKAVARGAEIMDDSSHGFASSSCNSTDSLSTQDSDLVGNCDSDLAHHSKPDASDLSLFSSTALADGARDDDDDDDDDSYLVLQTDESMEAMSPSRDTDEDVDPPAAAAMAATGRSILCNLLWNNRSFRKSDNPESQSGFVWPEMPSQSVSMWPSKPSTVKVFP